MDQDKTWHAESLGPGQWPHCIRWEPSSPPPKGHSPPIFGPCLLQPNGCMDQDATWYGGRPRPRRLCVRRGPCSPLTKKGAELPKFSAHVYCGQTAGWINMVLGMEVGLSPGDFVLDGYPALAPQKGDGAPPHFHGDPAPLPKKGVEPPIFGPCLLRPNGYMD